MKLENQLVSLELSKELKESGFKQQGLWWWCLYGKGWLLDGYGYEESPYYKDKIVAPTVAELGEALPIGNVSNKYGYIWNNEGDKVIGFKGFKCRNINNFKEHLQEEYPQVFEADTEANARAKMWLYLKKKGE